MKIEIFELWCKKILPHLHAVSLEGTAGETFLHPEIDYIITKIIEGDTCPNLVTNGHIFKEKTAEKIFKSEGVIGVSLDGIKPETYNKIRNGGDFNQVWENILKFESLKSNTKGAMFINTVYQKDNWFEMEELIDKCLALDIDTIIINEHRPTHYSYPDKIKLEVPGEGIIYLKKCIKKYSNNKRVHFNFYQYYEKVNNLNTCCSPWIHIWTGVKGECRICCIGDKDFWEKIPYRYITEEFDPVLFMNQKEFLEIRENMLKGIFPKFCQNCHLFWGINSSYLNR
jgi:hypothetical protein